MFRSPILSLDNARERARRPEYTGENRCIPCTVANLAIAAGASLAAGLLSPPLGLALFALSLGAIWLRGYLVPGTPELTKRYFPDWLLAVFDKHERPEVSFDPDAFDVQAYLVESGLVVDDPDAPDAVLDPEFAAAWESRAAALAAADDERPDVRELARLVDLRVEDLDVEPIGAHSVVAYADDQYIGQWESRAAYAAEMAAATELDERHPAWRDLPIAYRSRLLAALRLFIESCPDCGGAVALGDEVVKSCCRSWHVVAAQCGDCGARLLEIDIDPAALGVASDSPDVETTALADDEVPLATAEYDPAN
jgi:hypothetical protein